MAIVSSTFGSPTNTGWNRRSRAGVLFDVLAILVERRRADAAQLAAGQGRLQAGWPRRCRPSAAPAPTTVCSSSMNRMTLPASVTSLSSALSRSSNSPRNFVPATSAPMSSAIDPLVLEAFAARRPARSAGRALRRSPSCRRPARRSAPGCSSSAARAPGSRGEFPGRGRSPGRACPAGPARRGRCRISRGPGICPRAFDRSRGPSRARLAARRAACPW